MTFTFLSLGFLLLYFDLIGYGLSFFVFLPFILGYILGRSIIKTASIIGLIFSLTIFFILLIAGQLEGMGCVLMSLPIVIIAVVFGAAIGTNIKSALKKRRENKKQNDTIESSLIPLLLFLCVGFAEKILTKNNREAIAVKTEMILPYSSMEVYETIKSVDTLTGEKPFLMKLDLPIPNKCILEKEEIGGIRTCYFSGGSITEKITQLEKGRLLKMDVIDYKLPGRKWLGFKEAIYYFDSLGPNSCKLTRITTYTSELTPRFYWQPLEKIGISEEHDYVFDNLKNDLKRRYSKQ